MNDIKITELTKGWGSIVSPLSKPIAQLDRDAIISLFEQKGALLFRGFELDPKSLTAFTDRFTETYSGEVERRGKRFSTNIIRSVDPWKKAVDLHSEGSFTPAWPEIIWFFCIEPPSSGGSTILCDGIELWNALPLTTKEFFQKNAIRYDAKIPMGNKLSGLGKRAWRFNVPGVSNAIIDWDDGMVELTQMRSAVSEGREKNTLCFANHLLIDVADENQLMRRTLLDGSEIPKEHMDIIKALSAKLTYEVQWQRGDLIMLDNKRLLHGRRSYPDGDPRDIVVIQTGRASFGYGSTTRRSVSHLQKKAA